MPHRVFTGCLVIRQEIVGARQAELKPWFLEKHMLHPAVEPGGMPFHIVNRNTVQINQPRPEMHRIGGGVICVCEIHLQPEVVGKHIPFEVYIFEIPENACTPRCVPGYVGCKSLHVGLHEPHVGMVDIECDVERIVKRENGTVDKRTPPLLLVDFGIKSNGLVFSRPTAFHNRVT